jgi:hypothetical protein
MWLLKFIYPRRRLWGLVTIAIIACYFFTTGQIKKNANEYKVPGSSFVSDSPPIIKELPFPNKRVSFNLSERPTVTSYYENFRIAIRVSWDYIIKSPSI